MQKKSFNINFNGRNIAVNCVNNDTYAVQISYKTLYLQLISDENGVKRWRDVEMKNETMLAKEIGGLILKHPAFRDHATAPQT